MPISQDELLDEAVRRWAALSEAQPDLTAAIDLQRQLLGEIIAVLDRLEQSGVVQSPLAPAAVLDKLQRGMPALRGQPIELPLMVLGPSLDRVCRYLADAGAAGAARHIIETLEAGRMTRGSLLGASVARNERAIRMGATQMGLSADLVWLVGELATAPFAHLLQRALFSEQESGDESAALRSALGAWRRGYCPACGSWPALAEYVHGARLLRCSFCGTAWEMPLSRCAYCARDCMVVAAPDVDASPGVLELCDGCGGYTKALYADRAAPFPLVAIEDMETLALDRIATERGYVRPPMPDLGAEATYDPPRECGPA